MAIPQMLLVFPSISEQEFVVWHLLSHFNYFYRCLLFHLSCDRSEVRKGSIKTSIFSLGITECKYGLYETFSGEGRKEGRKEKSTLFKCVLYFTKMGTNENEGDGELKRVQLSETHSALSTTDICKVVEKRLLTSDYNLNNITSFSFLGT